MGLLGKLSSSLSLALGTKSDVATQIAKTFEISECKPEDCESCEGTAAFPSSVSVDMESELWQSTKPWALQMLISTGKSDWIHSIADEKGSMAQALEKSQNSKEPWVGKAAVNGDLADPENKVKRLIISNSSMAPPEAFFEHNGNDSTKPYNLMLLPYFIGVENVSPGEVDQVMEVVTKSVADRYQRFEDKPSSQTPKYSLPALPASLSSKIKLTHIPNRAIVLLCSHRTRDKRCGTTATILKKEFLSQLRDHELDRDVDDLTPGGVNVFTVSHLGGHKFSANVIIYLNTGEAIWLARITPAHVKNIIEEVIIKGRVWPELLRGGFKSKALDW
ncbi:hypothetical protein NADFUDRAFT_45759 [Nadsonia fulvescens var. elongata DSM 6958]|uniref:Sucraseferredoxin-like protein n=1 Tax=Nadsonia fulvescens var. elongata DSM 6958 TaxID=857566 RepID=A0A1E3PM17_9ASCO|nr:hypothetical protein NADFUDRAFT_45759 [Nadsonia fulvescens var. elongata DSM 6958]